MPKYSNYVVTVYEVHSVVVHVEAESPQHAKERVDNIIARGDIDDTNILYEYTMPSMSWLVTDEKGNILS
jgi:hypothetical protein